MILKLKAFIYRLSNVFGLRIFLAQKEQDTHIKVLGLSGIARKVEVGLWQARHGFTSVWTYRMPFFRGIWHKLKHAFKG